MIVRKLANGNLVVPARVEAEGVIADGVRTVKPDDPEYERWLPFVTEETQ